MNIRIATVVAALALTNIASLRPSLALAADPPVCGDVNDSQSITAADALLVLKKSVDQPVTLDCAAFDEARCSLDTTGCFENRFDESGPTILDHDTGLEWEEKDAADGNESLANPHDVDNLYTWSSSGVAADGTVFTDFLAKLNGVGGAPCYLDHCDWRLPTIAELETINTGPFCEDTPCVVDPALLPAQEFIYQSAETVPDQPTVVRYSRFDNGNTSGNYKTLEYAVRAVRGRLQ